MIFARMTVNYHASHSYSLINNSFGSRTEQYSANFSRAALLALIFCPAPKPLM